MTIENLVTPPGRVVWGNPAKTSIKKDQNTNLPIIKDGKQVEQWAFGVAFQKHEFNQFVLPYMQQEAATAYPNGVPQKFSWKYKDGDGVDGAGKLYSTREGYAGHCVLTVATEAFAPPIYKFENGAYRQIAPEEIKTGDYVVLNLNMKVNVPTNPSHTPGLYINPNGIELVGYGAAILQSANPDEMFGGRQYQLPPGASATPIAGNHGVGMPIPNVATAPIAAPMAYQPQPPMAPAGAPLPPPAYDFVQNAGNAPAAYAPQGYPTPQNGTPAPVGAATQFPTNPATPQGYPQQQMQGMPPAR